LVENAYRRFGWRVMLVAIAILWVLGLLWGIVGVALLQRLTDFDSDHLPEELGLLTAGWAASMAAGV
jgi:hypothetical protein